MGSKTCGAKVGLTYDPAVDVAVVATISAGIVTVVGIIANAYTAKQQRVKAIELAEKAQSHERDLARGDRLYGRRAPVYEEMITTVHAVMEHERLVSTELESL